MGEYTDKVKGNVNQAMGEAKQDSDNPRVREEGREQETKGEAQETKGKVKGIVNEL